LAKRGDGQGPEPKGSDNPLRAEASDRDVHKFRCGLKQILQKECDKHDAAHDQFGAVLGYKRLHAVKVGKSQQFINTKNPAITGRVWGLLLLDLNQRPSD
jgi:hypothetical protein